MFINNIFMAGMKAAGYAGKNVYRGIRGEAKAMDFVVGEKAILSPRQRMMNDLKKRVVEMRSGAKVKGAGANVEAVHEVGEDGISRVVKKNRASSALGLISDATVGSMGLALGWGSKAAVGGTLLAAKAAVKPAGHAAYQAYGIARDIGIGGAGLLHSASKTKLGAAAMLTVPAAFVVGGEAFQQSEHGAVDRGLKSFEGQTIDSAWGSITESNRELESITRSNNSPLSRTKSLDTFGANGDLVFAMHNQR